MLFINYRLCLLSMITRSLCYPPKLQTEAENTKQNLDDSSRYLSKIESSNTFYFQAYNFGAPTFTWMKTIVCRYDVTSTYMKTTVCKYDATKQYQKEIAIIFKFKSVLRK